METDETHEGGCLCGAVRYRVSGTTVWSAVCYCDSCARAAGAPAVGWAGFPNARFAVVRGRPSIYESSPGVLRGFCGRCGTTLTYQKNPEVLQGAQDDVYITTRTLDEPNAFPPAEHVYYGERPKWLNVSDGLPHHERLSEAHAHRQLAMMVGKELRQGDR